MKLSNGKFTVPTDGSAGIVYRIIGSRSSSLAPAEGDGTAANPYKISSIDDLNLIQANQGYRREDKFFSIVFQWNAGRSRFHNNRSSKASDPAECRNDKESEYCCGF